MPVKGEFRSVGKMKSSFKGGTTAPGIHFWKKICACGLFAEFHGARIATNNLHKSDCMAEVHDNLESSKILDVRLRFGGAGSEVSNSRRLGSGDGVAEVDGPPGHADTGQLQV